jgi:hypothetical protein
MNCDTIRELLPLFDDGRLTVREQMDVRDHLLRCSSCRDELNKIRETSSFLHLLKEEYHDPKKVNHIIRQVKKDQKRVEPLEWMRNLLRQPVPLGGVLIMTVFLATVMTLKFWPENPIPLDKVSDISLLNESDTFMSFQSPVLMRAFSDPSGSTERSLQYAEIKTADINGHKQRLIERLNDFPITLVNESVIDENTILLLFTVRTNQQDEVITQIKNLGYTVIPPLVFLDQGEWELVIRIEKEVTE